MERMLLSRGLFSQQEALARRKKREMGPGWQRELLVVDGHNVQITIESYIEGRPLLKANDGALRDIAGLSSRYRMTETSNMALDMVFRFFEEFPPGEVLFLFDEPMSRSGELAAIYRDRLIRAGISGGAGPPPYRSANFPIDRCVAAEQRPGRHGFFLSLDGPRLPHYRVFQARRKSRPTFPGSFLPNPADERLFEDGGPFW